jgi:hypothetical protein
MFAIFFCLFWNILWMSISDIKENNMNYGHFDYIMLRVSTHLYMMAYYVIIVAGPLDICKVIMLRENKRIYALLILFIGGIKFFLEAIIFDEHIANITNMNFFTERVIVSIFNIFAICSLITIFRDEIKEI